MQSSDSYSKVMLSISKEVKKALHLTDMLTYARDAVTYESSLSSAIGHNYIKEEYHIVNTFMECAKDIIENLDRYSYTTKYSGWTFDRKNKQCIPSKNIDLQLGIPVYVSVINDERYANIMAVQDRSICDDKITIIINAKRLSDIDNNIAILGHEFRHALEMYVDKESTHIDDNIIDVSKDFVLQKKFEHTSYLDDAVNVVTLFLTSEERARIDGTIHYLKRKCFDVSDMQSTTDKIVYLVKETENCHLMATMRLWLSELQLKADYGMYLMPILVGHLWNKYNRKKINVDISINDINNHIENGKQLCDEILKFLNKNYYDFHKRLIDCIATHILLNYD